MASVLGRGFQPAALAEIAGCSEEDLQARLGAGARLRTPRERTPAAVCDSSTCWCARRFTTRCRPPSGGCCTSARRSACGRGPSRAPRSPGPRWPSTSRNPATRAGAEAVDAWRKAAHQAEARHSFDDAALCYNRALTILGDTGHDARRAGAPVARARGGADTRRRPRSRPAQQLRGFPHRRVARRRRTARRRGAHLRQHIHLWQCRSAAGRLAEDRADAASTQTTPTAARDCRRGWPRPCNRPPIPPNPSRSHARRSGSRASAGDARTLLTTLRSAVSALMDFGDPLERLALNQEHVAPGAPARRRARMHARLHALGGRRHGARRRGHARRGHRPNATRWPISWACLTTSGPPRRCASCARRSRGEFAAAEAALARARRLADRAQDSNAALTLLVQQLALAEMKEDLRAVRIAVRAARASMRQPAAFGDVPEAGAAAATARFDWAAKLTPADLDESYLRRHHPLLRHGGLRDPRRLPGGAWRSRTHRSGLRRHSSVPGPVRTLGAARPALDGSGRAQPRQSWRRRRVAGEAANEHFATAVEIARRMDARPWFARIVLEWIESLQRIGAVPSAPWRCSTRRRPLRSELGLQGLEDRLAQCRERRAHPRSRTTPAGDASPAFPRWSTFACRRDGEVWVCECDGTDLPAARQPRHADAGATGRRSGTGDSRARSHGRQPSRTSRSIPAIAAKCSTSAVAANTGAASNRCARSSRKPRAIMISPARKPRARKSSN